MSSAKSEDELQAAAQRFQECYEEYGEHSEIVVIFSVMALEAYIYDYAARHFSDSFARKYVDKLDLPSKWVVVPQLATGKAFPRGGQGFGLLKRLVTTRHSLIHAKSSAFSEAIDQRESISLEARDAIRALDLLAAGLMSIDPDEPAFFFLVLEDSEVEEVLRRQKKRKPPASDK
ncbi:MAG: hypothetical protein M5R40_15385 [Anaerolineae bacterium]|nr:hypothetical protein [Anaerolineae bacterium]